MPDVLVVSSFLPGERPVESDTYEVSGVLCDSSLAYADGLMRVWGSDRTLINVEHDMEFSDELVAGLLSCDGPLCAYPYLIWSFRDKWHYAQATGPMGRLQQGDTSCAHSSIGFCKISPEARVRPLMRLWWQYVEHGVHSALGGQIIEDDPHHINKGISDPSAVREILPPICGPWHIHWPEIGHFHDYAGAGECPVPLVKGAP